MTSFPLGDSGVLSRISRHLLSRRSQRSPTRRGCLQVTTHRRLRERFNHARRILISTSPPCLCSQYSRAQCDESASITPLAAFSRWRIRHWTEREHSDYLRTQEKASTTTSRIRCYAVFESAKFVLNCLRSPEAEKLSVRYTDWRRSGDHSMRRGRVNGIR